MEIIGYSERGAMNALFYGMAHDDKENGEAAMNALIHLADIEPDKQFKDFVIYNEFSLSDFGDPDMMITAKKEDKYVLFFIEAKVSCGSYYDLSKQWKSHTNQGKKDTSNLFFQLMLKKYFFERFKCGKLDETKTDESGNAPEWLTKLDKRGKERGENLRYIGKNVVVNKLVNELKNLKISNENAYYIAIIPKQKDDDSKEKEIEEEVRRNVKENYSLDVHIVTWEDIYNWEDIDKKKVFQKYLKGTIGFNQEMDENGKVINKNGKNQIVNYPQQIFK